jgi:hypothetical protein
MPGVAHDTLRAAFGPCPGCPAAWGVTHAPHAGTAQDDVSR